MKISILFFFMSSCCILSAQEICNNGIDDDADGFIDFNDSIDCFCSISDSSIFSVVQSLIPNPSFEDYNCFPTNFSTVNCADSWIQASTGTSDYFVADSSMLNLLSTYGNYSFQDFNFLAPQPLPDGLGFVGFGNSVNYKEYVGACLTDTMLVDSSYTFQFSLGFMDPNIVSSDPINLSFFASTSCLNLPFGNYASECPLDFPEWKEVANIYLAGNYEWIDTNITFVADSNYTTLVVGGSCNTASFMISYYYLDNLIVNNASIINTLTTETISSSKLGCNQYNLLVENIDNHNLQWYKDGIALVGETQNILNVQNDIAGNYTVQISNNMDCYFSNSIILVEDIIPDINTISGDTSFNFLAFSNQQINLATSLSNFQIDWQSNSFLSCLNCLSPQYFATQNEVLVAEITDLNNLCKSSIMLNIIVYEMDTLTEENNEPIEESCFIYIPNVFTPNNDGINDQFNIFLGDCYATIRHFLLYNRFGENIYHIHNSSIDELNINWLGNYTTKNLNSDVFYYVLQLERKNGELEDYKGNLTLLK